MNDNTIDRATPSHNKRRLFVVMTAATLLMGVALYLFRDWWGLDHGDAALLSGAFLVVGVADLVILKNWSKIFAPKS